MAITIEVEEEKTAKGSWEPSLGYVLDLRHELEQRYASRNARIGTWRAMRRDEVEIKVPTVHKTTTTDIKLGLPRVWLRRTIGVLTSKPPRFKVSLQPNATTADRVAASAREVFAAALWKQVSRQQHVAVFRRIVDHQAGDGQGWLKLVYRPDAWYGAPEVQDLFDGKLSVEELTPAEQSEYNRRFDAWKRDAPVPFAFRVPDPTTVFPVWGEYGLDAVIEINRRPYDKVQRMLTKLGGQPFSLGDSAPGELQVLEYWDPTWQVVVVNLNGGWVKVWSFKHRYGFVPYFHAPGWEETDTDPAEQYLSVLTPLEGQLSWLYTMLTAKGHRVWSTSYPSYQAFGYVGGVVNADGSPRPFELEIGKVHPVEPGSDGIQPIKQGDFSNDMEEVFAILARATESTQMDASAEGGGTFAGESGYFRSLRADLSRIPFDQLAENAAGCIADAMARVFELIDTRIKDRVVVRYGAKRGEMAWASLGPEEILENYDIDVEIEPDDDLNLIAKERHYQTVWQSGFMSQYTSLDRAGFQSPEEEIDRIAFEKLMATPMMQAWEMEMAMAKIGKPISAAAPQLALPPPQGLSAGEMGAMTGGRPAGMAQAPGMGAPMGSPANQPGPQQVTVS